MALAATVNAMLYQRRLFRKDLSGPLGVTPGIAAKKVRGDVGWSLTDLYRVAAFLGVSVADLLPKPLNAEATEFEPAQIPYKLRAQRDLNPQPSDP